MKNNSLFPEINHNLTQQKPLAKFLTKMFQCSVCHCNRSLSVTLCANSHSVCLSCAISLYLASHFNCPLCRRRFTDAVIAELAEAAGVTGVVPAPANHIPFPALPIYVPGISSPVAVTNVRDAMDPAELEESTPIRSVRRRLLPETVGGSDSSSDSFFINGLLAFPGGVRPDDDIISFNFPDIRWDTETSENRFLIVNGPPRELRGQLPNTLEGIDHLSYSGFNQHNGFRRGLVHYTSTKIGHLPPIPFGPLYQNNIEKIPAWCRQQFRECKFFYMRDQLVRGYNPWFFGHRPWRGGASNAADRNGPFMNATADLTNLYTDTIAVVHQPPYVTWNNRDRGIFLTLAHAWCLEANLLPSYSVAVPGNNPDNRWCNISPVHSRSLRVSPGAENYCEFDLVCVLSVRNTERSNSPWRSGPFLFLTYRKVNNIWSISNRSIAVFPSAGTPSYSPENRVRLEFTSISNYVSNLL